LILITGIKITFLLFIASSVLSFLLGTIVAILRVSRVNVLQKLGIMYVKVFQSIPVLFWLLFLYYVFPDLLPAGLGNILNTNIHYPVIAGISALTLDNASYVSDILRNGRFLIPDTQRDVAIATGLSRIQQYIHVLLPQMFRVTLPPLGTRMVHNFKNTTLCMVITANEMMWATQHVDSLSFRGVEAIMAATVFYVCLSIFMASTVIILERYLKIDAASIIKARV
jgi:polar amino acid transport system permease protein